MNGFVHLAFEQASRPWWGFASWLVPVLLVAALVGVAVWLVARAATPAHVTEPADTGTNTTSAADSALDTVRMRYAHGQIGRDEFLRLSATSAAPTTDPFPPAPSDASRGTEGEEVER